MKIKWFIFLALIFPVRLESSTCKKCHSDIKMPSYSVHRDIDCLRCHTQARSEFHGGIKSKVDCGKCHVESSKRYFESIHGKALKEGNPDVPSCIKCHGGHEISKVTSPMSPVYRENVNALCISCHVEKMVGEKYRFPGIDFIKSYEKSVHSKKRDGKAIAVCIDCHGAHTIKPSDEPESTVNKRHIPEICGECHPGEREDYTKSIHYALLQKGEVKDAPVCTTCHGEHLIVEVKDPASSVYPSNIPGNCATCHEEVRLTRKYSMVTKRLTTYFNTFHGIAIKFGETRVANCASCHGYHLILPASDPASSVHPDNLKKTCGKCHPGSTENFAKGKVHVEVSPQGAKGVYAVRIFYTVIIAIFAIGFLFHILFDYATYRRKK
jgi:hypothetical protein